MTREYKLTPSSRWNYYYRIQLTTCSLHVVGAIIFLYYKDIIDIILQLYIFFGILLGWLFFFALPVFLLYFNHKKYSKSVVLKQEGGRFVYSDLVKSIFFTMDDIVKIELWLSPPKYDKRIDILYFGKYHFTSIYIKQGQIINLSCLVFDKTKEVFSEKLIENKKKAFPFMPC